MVPDIVQIYWFMALLRTVWEETYDIWGYASSTMGLCVAEDQVLWAVYAQQPTTITDLIGYMGRDKSTISRYVRSLENLGYIERDEMDDRRFQEIRLTPRAEEAVSKRIDLIMQLFRERGFLSNLSNGEFKTLLELFSKIRVSPKLQVRRDMMPRLALLLETHRSSAEPEPESDAENVPKERLE